MKHTLLQRFGLFFYDKRETTFLLWLAVLVFGFVSYASLITRQGFPAVDVPVTLVSGTYFVNDSSQVDRDVIQPASQIIAQLPEVKKVTSHADANFFSMVVEFRQGEVTSQASSALLQRELSGDSSLPASAGLTYKPVEGAKFTEGSDILVSIYSPSGMSVPDMEAHAAQIASLIDKRPGVDKATPIVQTELGVNPLTGQLTSGQRRFDRIGFRDSNREFKSYPAVNIGIVAAANKDTLELSEEISAYVSQLDSSEQIPDLDMRVTADLASGVRTQLSGLQESLLEGLAIVILVSLLLISWRAGLAAALSMVTVLLMTAAVLYATGNSLNTVTLFALILCLGLVVDDTTIMVEAIDAAKRRSRSRRTIIAHGIKSVGRASTAGTFTTMLAFAPMLFVGGILGEFIRILPVTIIVSLAVSLLVSLTLVPFLSGWLILGKRPGSGSNPFVWIEQDIARGVARLVMISKSSPSKGVVLGTVALTISFGLIIASVPVFQKLKFDIFPATKDTNVLAVNLSFTNPATVGSSVEVASRADQLIQETLGPNMKQMTYRTSGTALAGTAYVDLVNYKDRDPTSGQLIKRLQAAFAGFEGAAVKVRQIDVGPPKEDLPFQVQIASPDPDKTAVLAADIQNFLDGHQLQLTGGKTANIVQTDISPASQVMRIDGKQVIEVKAGFEQTDTSALVLATKDEVQAVFTPERLEREYAMPRDALAFHFGNESGNQESFQSMIYAFPILLLMMYLLMAFQFKSFLQPILIFVAIPFSLFGVAVGLWVTDNPLSFFVLIGCFALIGIVVNNTILLTDYANQARAEGADKVQAIALAIQARFRPLLVTSFTAVVGLIPLALSDPFWESISYTLIFGLLSSTFSVIVAFPYLYLAGESLRDFGSRVWRRRLPKTVQYPIDVIIAPIRIAHISSMSYFGVNIIEQPQPGSQFGSSVIYLTK